jgi:phosphate transport system protein
MNAKHIQKSFDLDLQDIKNRITIMAEMVSKELSDSVQAFSERDESQAADSVAADDLVNASERIIDDLVVSSVVRHQPMATDLRHLLSALRISRELERIGDYAKNVAKHSITLDHLKLTGEEQRVLDMGHAVNTMLEEVIEAYNDQDINKAELVRDQDQDIDELFTKIFSDLLKINENNAHLASACSHLLFIARGFERIGDHATDIAEEVIFLVKGEFPEDDRVKADFSASIDG